MAGNCRRSEATSRAPFTAGITLLVMIISIRVWDRSSSAPKAGSEHDDLVTLLFQGAPDKVSDHRLVIED
jgi:hypothetical protein